MQYELVCGVVRTVETTDEATRQALLDAVAVFERALQERRLAAIVQVRDVRIGRLLHESVQPGGLAPGPQPHCPAIACAM